MKKLTVTEDLKVLIKGKKLIGDNQHYVAMEVLMMSESGQHFLMNGNGDVIRNLSEANVQEWGMDADNPQPEIVEGVLTIYKSL